MTTLTLGLALIALGFLLMVAELFLPSGGILSVVALSAVCAGLIMTFLYDTYFGLWTLVGVFIALPVLGSILLHYWPKTAMGRRLFLTPPEEDATVSLPMFKEMEELRGRVGKTMSTLRPSGIVDFEGRRIDCISEGMMVEPDQWVRCVDVQGGKVIVRAIDKPQLHDLENVDFS